MIARKLYYWLTPNMRRVARRLVYFPWDMWEALSGKRAPMVPPRGMIYTGSGDFINSGKQLAKLCIEHGNIKPDAKVLDVGCGIGRLAVALTKYLSPQGNYYGFDVVEDGIKWCRSTITPSYPNFEFRYIPLRNDLYNLDAKARAEEFNFPYTSHQFDLVVLTSVFTHMQPAEVSHYLTEIKRVLKPGGICLATFFVIDQETLEYIRHKPDVMQFNYEFDTHYLHDKNVKDANIAFKWPVLQQMSKEAELTITHYHKGWWRGMAKDQCLNFQDVLLFKA